MTAHLFRKKKIAYTPGPALRGGCSSEAGLQECLKGGPVRPGPGRANRGFILALCLTAFVYKKAMPGRSQRKTPVRLVLSFYCGVEHVSCTLMTGRKHEANIRDGPLLE
jgi:hypothetical protein